MEPNPNIPEGFIKEPTPVSLKFVVSTSDKYHHLLPVFFYLYGKYWNEPFDLIGYAKPDCPLPDNCTWVSMGVQGGKSEFSTDLRRYFEAQTETHFVWLFEDTFLREQVDEGKFADACALMMDGVGRIDLTNDVQKREHNVVAGGIVFASPTSRYRLSTQPSIWSREYLLQYMTEGLSPWEFETQDPVNDNWNVCGLLDWPVQSNEGVRRHDIQKLNLDKMAQEDIDHINKIAVW